MESSSAEVSPPNHDNQSQAPSKSSSSQGTVPLIDLTGCDDSPTRATRPGNAVVKSKKRPASIDTSFRGPLKNLINEQKTIQRRNTEKSQQAVGNEFGISQFHDDNDLTPTIAQLESAAIKLKAVPITAETSVSTSPLTAVWNPILTLSTRKHPKAFADAAALLKTLPASCIESATRLRSGSHPADRVAVALVAAKNHIEAQAHKLTVAEGQKLMLQKQANLDNQQSQAWKKKYLECSRKCEDLQSRLDDHMKRGGQSKARLDLIRSARKIEMFGSSQGPKGGLAGWIEDKSNTIDVLLSNSTSLGARLTHNEEPGTTYQADEETEPIVWSQENLLQNLLGLSRDKKAYAEKLADDSDLCGNSEAGIIQDATITSKTDLCKVTEDEREEGEVTEDESDVSSIDLDDESDDLYLPYDSQTPCPPRRRETTEDTLSTEVIRAAQFGTRAKRSSHA